MYDEYDEASSAEDEDDEDDENMDIGEDRLCDFCREREAALFIDQVSKEGRRKIKVCMECAVERGFSPDPENIKESMTEFINNIEKEVREEKESRTTFCPKCGSVLSDVKLSGRVGCPACYEAFKGYVASVMEVDGERHYYTGSLPRRIGQLHSHKSDLIELKNKEREAVKGEDYEKAAFYRDCIKAIEQSLA